MQEHEPAAHESLHDIALRAPTDADRETALRIYNAAYHDVVVAQFGPWDQTVQTGFFQEAWEKPELKIIEYGGAECGIFIVEDKPEGYFINEIIIDPAYQGKGVGSTLIRRLQASAASGMTPVRLEVLKKNARAKELYERLGFKDFGETETHYQMQWFPVEKQAAP